MKNIPILLFASNFNQVKIAEPLGISYLAAILTKKKLECEIFEPLIEGNSIEESVEIITNKKPKIIGISMMRDRQINDVLKICDRLKVNLPNAFIVIGGHGPSIATQSQEFQTLQDKINLICSNNIMSIESRKINITEIINESQRNSSYYNKAYDYYKLLNIVDTFVLGESDNVIGDLFSKIQNKNNWKNNSNLLYRESDGSIKKTKINNKVNDLDLLPFMSRDILKKYLLKYKKPIPASIISSRGCYYNCSFCSVIKFERIQGKIRYRRRSNQNIALELKQLYEKFNINHFNFEDDNFIPPSVTGKAEIIDLCDKIADLPFSITFTIFCRADVIDYLLFKKLKSVGLNGIYFGVESISNDDLTFFNKKVLSSEIELAMDILLSLGFSPSVDATDHRLMLGYITWHPTSSYHSLKESSKFMQRYNCPPKLLRRKLRLYSGTNIISHVKNMGLLNSKNPDGWDYQHKDLSGLDSNIDNFFQLVNKKRDKLRTIEKAVYTYGYEYNDILIVKQHRKYCDNLLFSYFDKTINLSERSDISTNKLIETNKNEFIHEWDKYNKENNLSLLIDEIFNIFDFNDQTIDLYRK